MALYRQNHTEYTDEKMEQWMLAQFSSLPETVVVMLVYRVFDGLMEYDKLRQDVEANLEKPQRLRRLNSHFKAKTVSRCFSRCNYWRHSRTGFIT